MTAKPTTEVEVGRTAELVATLVVGGRVRAVVRDAEGHPVAPRALHLLRASDGVLLGAFVHQTVRGWLNELDSGPNVLLDAMPAGPYRVRATMEFGTTVSRDVEVRAGETSDVELTLAR